MRRYILASLLFLFAACAVSQVVMLQRRPTVASTFSPSDLAPLTIWLAADSAQFTGFSDGDAITSWTNKLASKPFVLSQATADQKPVFTNNANNSKPAISLDGINDNLNTNNVSITNFVGTNAFRVFTVVNYAIADSGMFFRWFIATSNQFIIQKGNDLYFWYASDAATISAVCTNLGGKYALYEFYRDGSSSVGVITNGVLCINGSPLATNLVNVTGSAYLGFPSALSTRLDVQEIIFYNQYLSDVDAAKVRLYLNGKYALW